SPTMVPSEANSPLRAPARTASSRTITSTMSTMPNKSVSFLRPGQVAVPGVFPGSAGGADQGDETVGVRAQRRLRRGRGDRGRGAARSLGSAGGQRGGVGRGGVG